MADSTNVESGLATDDLGRQWMKGVDVFVRLILQILVMSVKLFDLFFGKAFDIFHGFVLKKIKEMRFMILNLYFSP